MAIDLAALRAKIAAQKAAIAAQAQEKQNETNATASTNNNPSPNGSNHSDSTGIQGNPASTANVIEEPTAVIKPPDVLGTSKTSEIDHLDFIAKMNSLAGAIHKQHPLMPTLLQQIHKQLRSDPELVTTLDDEAIGIIVRGLQIQTKTELVVAATTSKGKSKKVAVSVDML